MKAVEHSLRRAKLTLALLLPRPPALVGDCMTVCQTPIVSIRHRQGMLFMVASGRPKLAHKRLHLPNIDIVKGSGEKASGTCEKMCFEKGRLGRRLAAQRFEFARAGNGGGRCCRVSTVCITISFFSSLTPMPGRLG